MATDRLSLLCGQHICGLDPLHHHAGLHGQRVHAPCDLEELESRTLMSGLSVGVEPPVAPEGVAAAVAGPRAVRLAWANSDRSVTGYSIMRSEDGQTFTQVARITTAATLRYADATPLSNHTYQYQVRSINAAGTSDTSATVTVTTPLNAPTAVVGIVQGLSGISLTWRDNDSDATVYRVLRSTDGRNFSVLTTLDNGDATSFTDSAVTSGLAYWYQVQAATDANASATSSAVRAVVPLSAPTGVQATATPTSVSLAWSGNDPAARNMVVQRSTDGRTYSTLATLAPGATSYTDTRVATGTAYIYRVVASNAVATAGVSDLVRVTTPLAVPTNLAAAMSTVNVSLLWSDSNRAGVGYRVLRSSDGETYAPIGTVAAGAARRFTDTAVDPNQTYSYKVQAVAGLLEGDASVAASVTTPDGSDTVTITSRYGNELVLTSYGATDTVAVSQDGDTLTMVLDGQTFTHTVTGGGLFIYDRGGADSITIDSTVSVRTTITSLGNAATAISSGTGSVSVWMDSTDVFSGQGAVHGIASFYGGTTKAVGASLANPRDAGRVTRVYQSLWGSGPSETDINQGSVGDCYFLASLAAFASGRPEVLQESAVDLGDGTFVVRYMRQTTPVYIRVSNELPSGTYGRYRFARPGSSGSIWAPVMEKAFAAFRTGANTYASISAGWMATVYAALGVNSTSFSLPSSDAAMSSMLTTALSGHLPVTFGTHGTSPNLVRGHAYTLVSVTTDDSGNGLYRVRNPWGVRGVSIEDSGGYSTLTYAQMRANFAMGVIAA